MHELLEECDFNLIKDEEGVVLLQGTTSILRTSIPHFRDVVIMAFECPHCGLRQSICRKTQIDNLVFSQEQ